MDLESGLPGGSADAGTTMDYEESNMLGFDAAGRLEDSEGAPTPAQQASDIESAEAKDISEGDQLYLVSEG